MKKSILIISFAMLSSFASANEADTDIGDTDKLSVDASYWTKMEEKESARGKALELQLNNMHLMKSIQDFENAKRKHQGGTGSLDGLDTFYEDSNLLTFKTKEEDDASNQEEVLDKISTVLGGSPASVGGELSDIERLEKKQQAFIDKMTTYINEQFANKGAGNHSGDMGNEGDMGSPLEDASASNSDVPLLLTEELTPLSDASLINEDLSSSGFVFDEVVDKVELKLGARIISSTPKYVELALVLSEGDEDTYYVKKIPHDAKEIDVFTSSSDVVSVKILEFSPRAIKLQFKEQILYAK